MSVRLPHGIQGGTGTRTSTKIQDAQMLKSFIEKGAVFTYNLYILLYISSLDYL